MKSIKLILLSFISLFLFVSCEKESPISAPEANAEAANIKMAKQKLVAFAKQNKFKSNARISASGLAKLGQNADYSFNKYLVKKAINPDDYECGPTILDPYIESIIENWTNDDFLLFAYFGSVVFDYAYVFANSDGGQYYGPTGQYSNQINRNFKDLQRFWNIPTDILMRDAHGNIFEDTEKVISILLLYGYDEADSIEIADLLKIVFGSPNFQKYNHPLLTFNAFAAPADTDFGTPKKIVMGDGIMQAYDDLGFGDVAPQTILAHEYGHHIQFAKNVEFLDNPESTRRTELMADAFSSYFLTHKRGAAMNWKRVQQFLEVSYSIGDCAFTNNGHHGTPNQRRAASAWGYNLANDVQKQGKILTSEAFIAAFEVALPSLVAPDAL